ncbi:hypothetical protein BX285_4246 [Streptomyces sp. 1114.5]|uniref:hypothetical protein n=1 Tax=Streptomyces sp. 1114.5 TaxID=1938830 RepID=UPI000EB54479|nr:hypothetical protein [Streptomyces sp. 1114.5]RKT19776.1 hypothetical protein BX285_4246 [Streptomyces sp. 1114.5]
MTWLRVLTALGILAVAASALLVFALCTATARGERAAREEPPPDLRTDAEGSGLFQRMGGGDS